MVVERSTLHIPADTMRRGDEDLKLGSTNPNDGPMKILDDDRHDAGAKFVLVSAGTCSSWFQTALQAFHKLCPDLMIEPVLLRTIFYTLILVHRLLPIHLCRHPSLSLLEISRDSESRLWFRC